MTTNVLKWRKVIDPSGIKPNVRHGHRAVAIKEFIVVFGGGNSGIVNDFLVVYNIATNNWFIPVQKGDIPPGCASFGMVVDNTRILMFGGTMEYNKYTDNLFELQASRWEWKSLDPKICPNSSPPEARIGHSFTLIENKVYLFGGLVVMKNNVATYLNDLFILELGSNQSTVWIEPIVYGTCPSPRESHSAVAHTDSKGNPKLIIFGGMTGHRLGDLWVLDIHAMTWNQCLCEGIPPTPRSLHSATVVGHKMYIFGGWVHSVSKDIDPIAYLHNFKCSDHLACLNLQNMSWEDITIDQSENDIPGARAGHCAVAVHERIYIFSGRDGYRRDWINQLCWGDLWYMEVSPPGPVGKIQLHSPANNELDIFWPRLPLTECYLLQIQKLGSSQPKASLKLFDDISDIPNSPLVGQVLQENHLYEQDQSLPPIANSTPNIPEVSSGTNLIEQQITTPKLLSALKPPSIKKIVFNPGNSSQSKLVTLINSKKDVLPSFNVLKNKNDGNIPTTNQDLSVVKVMNNATNPVYNSKVMKINPAGVGKTKQMFIINKSNLRMPCGQQYFTGSSVKHATPLIPGQSSANTVKFLKMNQLNNSKHITIKVPRSQDAKTITLNRNMPIQLPMKRGYLSSLVPAGSNSILNSNIGISNLNSNKSFGSDFNSNTNPTIQTSDINSNIQTSNESSSRLCLLKPKNQIDNCDKISDLNKDVTVTTNYSVNNQISYPENCSNDNAKYSGLQDNIDMVNSNNKDNALDKMSILSKEPTSAGTDDGLITLAIAAVNSQPLNTSSYKEEKKIAEEKLLDEQKNMKANKVLTITQSNSLPPAPSFIKICQSLDNVFLSWAVPQSDCPPVTSYLVTLAVKQRYPNNSDFVKVYSGPNPHVIIPNSAIKEAKIDNSSTVPAIIFRISARNKIGSGHCTQVRWLRDNVSQASTQMTNNYNYIYD